jgi:hypothetical protein
MPDAISRLAGATVGVLMLAAGSGTAAAQNINALNQTGSQFLESENGVDRGFEP